MDRLAVPVEADGPARGVGDGHAAERLEEGVGVLDLAADLLEGVLQEEPRRVGADRVVARVGAEGLLVGADEGAVRRRVERGAVVHRRDDAERLVTHVPQQRLVHGGLVRQERDRAPEPGVLELLEEAERGDAGEADEDGVDVAAELADVGRLVRRAERGPELLDDLAARVLEGLVEARHHLVAEGEVVRDGRDFPVPERLRGVGAEGHGRLARGRGRAHEELGRLALGQVVGGGARRDRRDALGVHVRRERVGLEGGQGAEDDVDSALLDQLAGSRERAGGLATAVDDRQLDAPAGERALLLLEEQLDAVLHLFAGRRERPGQDRDEADADPLLRRGRRRGEDGERRERESTNDHARLLPSWAASEALG